jgi:hypothetical protein
MHRMLQCLLDYLYIDVIETLYSPPLQVSERGGLA